MAGATTGKEQQIEEKVVPEPQVSRFSVCLRLRLLWGETERKRAILLVIGSLLILATAILAERTPSQEPASQPKAALLFPTALYETQTHTPTATATSSQIPGPIGTPTATATPISADILVFYYSKQGSFSVRLPTVDNIIDDVFPQTLLGVQVPCQALVSKDYGALWFIDYWDYPPELADRFTIKRLLDAARDIALERDAVTLSSEEDIVVNPGYEGRSIAARSVVGENATYKARLYLAGKRIYLVAAKVYPLTGANRMSLVDPFLDSFYIEEN